MKLDRVAPVAEIISSIAIVLTLIYLSVQTQQTKNALVANSRQATLTADMALISTLVSNPEVAANAARPISELSTEEESQVANVFAGLMRTREFVWLQFQTGVLDEPTFESYMETLVRWIKDYEGYRYYWEYFSANANPEFVIYVNTKLEEQE